MVSEKMQGRARASRSRCVMNTTEEMSSQEEMMIKYVCGIDLGSQSCAGCITRPDKSVVVKPLTFTNTKEGWQVWEKKLSQLDALPSQILIGMEATSRDAGKSVSRVRAARLCGAFVACEANASIPRAARAPRQDRSARRDDHREGVVEWRSTRRLCPKRTSNRLSSISPPAHAALG